MTLRTNTKLHKRLSFLLLFCSVLFATNTWAQIIGGKVYNFENVGKSGKALSSNNNCTLGPAGINRSNFHQLWLAVEGEGENKGQFTLRNLGNGLYLNNPEEYAANWNLIPTIALDRPSYNYWVKKEGTDDIFYFSDVTGPSDKAMQLTNDKLICGRSDSNDSQWKIIEVQMTQQQIEEQLKKVANFEKDRTEYYRALIYEKSLYKVFSDKACTELTPEFRDMTDNDLENSQEYKKLPKVLRSMIKKIRGNDWTEKNADLAKPDWDNENARKFRVQMIEPYSDPHQAGLALRIQPHSVLNNPTGIYASKGDTLYVMLEGRIEPGSEVYFSSYQGLNRPENNAQRGTKLKEGLNIITYQRDSTCTFVCYNVETFKDKKKTERRLSQYKDLKIHIEGGSINGFYNHMGDDLFPADKNENWEYYEKRANMPFITILGKYQILQLYKDRMVSNDGKSYPGLSEILNDKVKIEDVIQAWDQLMFSQRLTLGVLSEAEIEEARKKYPTLDDKSRGIYGYIGNDPIADADYSDHYRVHGMALGQLTGYMVGSTGHSGYNISTFEAITVGMASKEQSNFGNIWGAAHEIGHQHQALLHMNGLKESSNNIFSNIAVWFDGKATSNMSDGALENLLKVYNRKDGDFFHTTLGVQMHLYYKLWLYYHLVGKDNKFYPRLFELLRRNPMNITVDQDGAQSLLHFYKMCCIAAQEDLTEFFRAHCFFTPLKQRHVADYTSSDYTMTQEQVDAAIAEVKDMGFPVNRNIIFINDCSGKPALSHDGVTQRLIYNKNTNADMGMYTDFIYPEQGKIVGTYTYRFTEGKIIMSGATGGVGFLAYDDEEMLQAFSDRMSFTLSERARKKLSSGDLSFYVIDGAGNMIEIKSNDVVGEQRELLRTAIADAKNLLKMVDTNNRKIGFFSPKSVITLTELIVKAEKVYDEKNKEAYISTSFLLTEECNRINEAPDSRISFVPNSSYLLECQHVPNKFIFRENDSKLVLRNSETNESQWLFEMVGENSFHIKHVASGKYMSASEKSVPVKLVDQQQAATYHIETLDDNYFAIGCSKGYLNFNHNQSYVQGWAKIEGAQSRWRLSLIDVQESEKAYQDLAKSLDKSETLVRKAANMTELVLQTNDSNADNFLYCNAPSAQNQAANGTAANGYNLLDNNVDTYLHTETDNNRNSEDGLDHYLKVDLKEQNLPIVTMRYTTRNADSQERPKTICIEGSMDGLSYTPIMTIAQGLPRHRTTEFETPFLDAGYRYLRFMVTATYGGKTSKTHPYFSMSSFGLTTPVLKDEYASLNLNALIDEIKEARAVLEAGRSQQAALTEAKKKLDAANAAFETALNDIDRIAIENKKMHLASLIGNAEKLLKEVATVTYKENRSEAAPVSVSLQCSDADGKNYISTNADHNIPGNSKDGDGVAALLDKNNNTFLHTRYSGAAVNETHHILVKLSENASNAEFDFAYTTRNNGSGPHPTEIRVEQSADGNQFTEIRTFAQAADAMPMGAAQKWNSPTLSPNGDYRYLRFAVTKSNNSRLHYGHHFFSMSEFGLRIYEYRTDILISKKDDLTCVRDSLVMDLELSKVTAQSVASMNVSETILDEQLVILQKAYDELLAAKEASAPYNALNEFSQTPSLPKRELTSGNKVGQWTAASSEAYNKAYARAAYLLQSKKGNAEDYTKALADWKKAYEALAINLPAAEKLYSVRMADAEKTVLLCTDADNILRTGADRDVAESTSVWQFAETSDGTLNLKNLHTASFVAGMAEGNRLETVPANGIRLKPLSDDGKVAIMTAGHMDEGTGETAWYIEEVTDPTSVGHRLTIDSNGYAGIYLEFPAQLPHNVEAYTVTDATADNVILTLLADNIIPAKTAVILKAPAGSYRLLYTEDSAFDAPTNLLRGTSFTYLHEGEPDTSYYFFETANGEESFNKGWLEYSADGSIAEGNNATDLGGYIKLAANSVYLAAPANSLPETLTVTFDNQTSGIDDDIADEKPQTIYDLWGRRIDKIRHSGLYIVNGEKIFIKME